MSKNKEDIRNSLLLAVNCGELERVKELVNCFGLSYSPDFHEGYALLFNATLFGYEKIVKFLLEKGANVNSGIDNTNTPLHFAAWFGDSELVQLLLDHKALIDAKDGQSETPLHIACRRGHKNVVQLLLDKGAKPDSITELPVIHKEKFVLVKIDQATFASACRVGHEGFKEILDYGAQIDGVNDCKPLTSSSKNDPSDVPENRVYRKSENEFNVRPLHLAAEMGHSEIVKLLLSKDTHVNAQTNEGSTPLLLAAAQGHTDVVRLLLECGANIYLRDSSNASPLFFAVQRKCQKMIECLLDRGAIFDGLTKKVLTKMVEGLLDRGAIEDDGNRDFSPLHLAVGRGLKEVVALFLNSGGDVNVKDQFSNTLISYSLDSSTEGEHAETIQMLLDHGADLKGAPNLLHKAVQKQDLDVCRILIDNEADVNALGNNNTKFLPSDIKPSHQVVSIYQDVKAWHLKDADKGISYILLPDADEESTPLHLACYQGCPFIVELLLDNGANTEARQVNGLTPLHIAAWSGYKEIIEILLKYNGDVDAQGASNETALHYAVMGSKYDVVPILLANGCDLNMESIDGETALELAIQPLQNKPRPNHSSSRRCRTNLKPRFSRDHYLSSILDTFKNCLVERKVAGLCVCEKVLGLVDLISVHDHQQECEEEMSRMKCESLLDKYTLHDVLMKQRNPMYIRNKSLVSSLETFNYSKYPIYKTLLQSTFRRSKERMKLLDSGREWLCILMITSNTLNVETLSIPAWPELEKIVSYLSNADLLSLIRCGENLKRQLCH